MLRIVGISDMAVSSNPGDVLITYSLGSCVGLSLYDPVEGIGGLIHCMLPLSRIDKRKAEANPCMFTDTGVVQLLREVLKQGGRKDRLVAKVAGGASVLDDKGLFKIGERNHTVLRKLLWRNNILIEAEDVGGTVARTMSLNVGNGETRLKIKGQERPL